MNSKGMGNSQQMEEKDEIDEIQEQIDLFNKKKRWKSQASIFALRIIFGAIFILVQILFIVFVISVSIGELWKVKWTSN